MSSLSIGSGTEVILYFSLANGAGDIIDSNFDREPASFVFGDGKLLPGFEQVLVGLQANAKRSFTIAPEQAFGLRKDENIKRVKKSVFAGQYDLEVGLVVGFKDAAGGEVPGVVRELGDDHVVVDFNHPLAGEPIQFEVEIVDVKPQSPVSENGNQTS